MNRILKVGLNQKGRDFVVGDLHGCMDLLVRALREAHFHPDRDRLFSVGDLVDRADGSERVEDLLGLPYVYATLGNHEDMLLGLYDNGVPDESVLQMFIRRFGARNGMSWWLDVAPDKRLRIIERFRKLPHVIELETTRGSVGLLHAEVPAGLDWSAFLQKVAQGDRDTLHTTLWGRDRVKDGDVKGVQGIDRIFVGHTPQRRARRLGNVYYVDTGAFMNVLQMDAAAHLTMANVVTSTQVLSAPPAANKGLNLFDRGGPATPFGAYAMNTGRKR